MSKSRTSFVIGAFVFVMIAGPVATPESFGQEVSPDEGTAEEVATSETVDPWLRDGIRLRTGAVVRKLKFLGSNDGLLVLYEDGELWAAGHNTFRRFFPSHTEAEFAPTLRPVGSEVVAEAGSERRAALRLRDFEATSQAVVGVERSGENVWYWGSRRLYRATEGMLGYFTRFFEASFYGSGQKIEGLQGAERVLTTPDGNMFGILSDEKGLTAFGEFHDSGLSWYISPRRVELWKDLLVPEVEQDKIEAIDHAWDESRFRSRKGLYYRFESGRPPRLQRIEFGYGESQRLQTGLWDLRLNSDRHVEFLTNNSDEGFVIFDRPVKRLFLMPGSGLWIHSMDGELSFIDSLDLQTLSIRWRQSNVVLSMPRIVRVAQNVETFSPMAKEVAFLVRGENMLRLKTLN